MKKMNTMERARGCLLGLASGDAVGTSVEFMQRGTFAPVTGMKGGGPFGLEPGQWTDDTSMALCLGESLLHCRGHDPLDQMKRYVRWWKTGYYSSNGTCFDIGSTVAGALRRFGETGNPLSGSADPGSAGNGSIMRLAPVVLFYHPDTAAVDVFTRESSRTTHGAQECLDSCMLLGRIIRSALEGGNKIECLLGHGLDSGLSPAVGAIARGDYREKNATEIVGSGYVVKSLEAAIWSFFKTDSFEDAILCAVNLGDDADTTAAICGQIAGAFYGVSGIPASWLETLSYRAEIQKMADDLIDHPTNG